MCILAMSVFQHLADLDHTISIAHGSLMVSTSVYFPNRVGISIPAYVVSASSLLSYHEYPPFL